MIYLFKDTAIVYLWKMQIYKNKKTKWWVDTTGTGKKWRQCTGYGSLSTVINELKNEQLIPFMEQEP